MRLVDQLANGPRPDFYRENWLSLNGIWQFEFDDENIGLRDRWYEKERFTRTIEVPFCYQSKRSGVCSVEKHEIMWYSRMVNATGLTGNIWLNFGAVDYHAMVWVNGRFAGEHTGGFTPFSLDITDFIDRSQQNFHLSVRVYDSYDIAQPRGKQHWNRNTDRCWYTATSGVWQSVWLESVPGERIGSVKITPDIDKKTVEIEIPHRSEQDRRIQWKLYFQDREVKSGEYSDMEIRSRIIISMEDTDPIDNLLHLWSPENPNLYVLELALFHGEKEQDRVAAYFGMRKIERRGNRILLNHFPLYQKLILDQGYWPDSLLTPPDGKALERDIRLVKKMGFNGVRKHQKLEDPRFYYYADVLGLLVWGEMPSNYQFCDSGIESIQKEWAEAVLRDYNHPCIVTWVPLNESWGVRDIVNNPKQQNFALSLYHLTKALDETRLVSTNDGWEWLTADLVGIHDYEPDGEVLSGKYKDLDQLMKGTAVGKMLCSNGFSYSGEPVVLSEFGGIAFEDGDSNSWGYSGKVKTEKEFLERFGKLFEAVKSNSGLCGYCYTQLTDVFQETNGLLDEDRKPKIPLDEIRKTVN